MRAMSSAIESIRDNLRALIHALLAELARLNRFAIAGAPNAARRERARMVAAELERRYRGPHRCC